MALEQIYTYENWEAITPSDTVNLPREYRAIYVGTGGDVAAVGANGNTSPHKGVPTGSYLLGRPKRINATGTTATDILGCW